MAFQPESFSNYILIDLIASTSNSKVFLAKPKDGQNSADDLVALKRMTSEISQDSALSEEFVHETNLSRQLNHPNIVRCMDSGYYLNRHFLVMEYLEGCHLRKFQDGIAKKDEFIPVEVSCYIMSCLLKALGYAHSLTSASGDPLLIVHRDVSPQNVLLSKNGEVKLADFGIAKMEAKSIKTATGFVKGKPAYISPEQILGQPADNRSDLYSAGVVLWGLLTNQNLFSGPDDMSIIREVLKGQILPPSTFNSSIQPELDAVVLKSVASNPVFRYASASEFESALLACLPNTNFEQSQNYISQSIDELFHQKLIDQSQAVKGQLEIIEKQEIREAELSSEFTIAMAAEPTRTMISDSQKQSGPQTEAIPLKIEKSLRSPKIGRAPKVALHRELEAKVRENDREKQMSSAVKLMIALVIGGALFYTAPRVWAWALENPSFKQIMGEAQFAKKNLTMYERKPVQRTEELQKQGEGQAEEKSPVPNP